MPIHCYANFTTREHQHAKYSSSSPNAAQNEEVLLAVDHFNSNSSGTPESSRRKYRVPQTIRRRLQLYEGNPYPLPGISLRGVAVSRLSHALNAVLVASLMWPGAVSFKKVIKSDDNQLAYAVQVYFRLLLWKILQMWPTERALGRGAHMRATATYLCACQILGGLSSLGSWCFTWHTAAQYLPLRATPLSSGRLEQWIYLGCQLQCTIICHYLKTEKPDEGSSQ